MKKIIDNKHISKKIGRAEREASRYYTAKNLPTKGFVNLVKTFPVVCGDDALAKKICSKGCVRTFNPGEFLSKQDSQDEGVYFIISGIVDVRVNGSSVARRKSKELIGEMSAMCFGTKRCASLVALTEVEALYMNSQSFVRCTEEFPQLLRLMFDALASRLRERNDAFRTPNTPPKIFVGSSTKGKDFAHAFVDKVKELIEKDARGAKTPAHGVDIEPVNVNAIETIEINYWDKEVFSPSGTTLNTLIEKSKEVDFAIFALTKDDLAKNIKGADRWLPRDNVIFEIGLFMGELSKERTYLVMEQSDFAKLKLPSDLQGFTIAVFNKKDPKSMPGKALEIANLIRTHGSISGIITK